MMGGHCLIAMVCETHNRWVAAAHSADPDRRPWSFDEAAGRIAGRFARVEPTAGYLNELLSTAPESPTRTTPDPGCRHWLRVGTSAYVRPTKGAEHPVARSNDR